MPALTVNLTESQMAFVHARAKAGGLGSASDYIAFLVQGEQLKEHRDKIDALLLEGLDSGPATPMTSQDWKDIERQGLARLDEEKQNATKRANSRRRPKRPA